MLFCMGARSVATYADLFNLPPHHTGQIVNGVLHAHPRPVLAHAAVATGLGEELGPPFRRGRGGPGGWVILYEPELHLGVDIVVPDLAGWRREVITEGALSGAFATLAPNWVCEVLSPSTARLDRGEKLEVYLRERVAHVWLVDPELHTLEILRLDGPSFRLAGTFAGDLAVRAEPFDAVEINLAALWNL
jgi:Uma2 family endonuclease